MFKQNYSFRKKSRGYIKKEEEEYPDQASHENNGYGQTAPIVIDYAHGHTAVTVKEQPMDVDQPDEEEGKCTVLHLNVIQRQIHLSHDVGMAFIY